MTNESKEKREDILLRILKITNLYEIDKDNKIVPMEKRLRDLNFFLEQRGITPEYLENYLKQRDDGEDIAAQTFLLANGTTVTRDDLNIMPINTRILLEQEIHATRKGMTVKQYVADVAKKLKSGGMFGGVKITPAHIIDEINNRWLLKRKASAMSELGLTNDEMTAIIKKVSEEFNLTYERILEALVRTGSRTFHPEDFRIRNFL